MNLTLTSNKIDDIAREGYYRSLKIGRSFVLGHIIDALVRRYDAITATPHPAPHTPAAPHVPLPSIHSDYLAALYRRTGLHSYRDASGPFRAEIADVEPAGHLVLRDEAGHLRRYAFKEVEYLMGA